MYEPALRRREELPQAPAWVMSIHLPSLVVAGRLDDADATVTFVEALAAERGTSADGPSFFALARGMSALSRGLARSAERWLREATAGMRAIAPARMPLPLSQLAEACALLGDAEGAAAASAEADALVANSRIFEGLVRRARGWAALAHGRRSAAIDMFVEAADWARAHGQHLAELFALHDVLRLGSIDNTASRLITLAPDVEGQWSPCFAEHARAVIADSGGALDAVATQLEQLGALLMAAEAAAQASAAYARAGRTSAAARATARAGVLAAACEGARTPILDEIDRPLPLTRREREVANLAATGMPSHTIAEQLFVSVRTVEGHLQNIYGKLGVDGRRGLARVLGESQHTQGTQHQS
jgi:ATP/maltotriose-dependent transcriptional regulator MalT